MSVVVATRGPSLALARLLRSLGRADGSARCELLLGLNGSAEASAARRLAARFAPASRARVVVLDRSYPGEARNRVARQASAPVLLFLDDDVEIPLGLLVAVEQAFAADAALVSAGGPNLTPPASPAFEELAGRVLASGFGTGPLRFRYRLAAAGPGSGHRLALCNLAVRRSVFEAGGFDPALACAEENELLARLRRARGRIAYRPELAVYHHRRRSLGGHLRQMVKYGFGRGQVIVRAPSLRQLPYAAPVLAPLGLAALAASGRAGLAGVALGVYATALGGAAIRLGRLRAATAAALLAATHVGYGAGLAAGIASESWGRARRARGRAEEALAEDAARTVLALLAATAFAVVAGVVAARALGPEGRGVLELGRTLSFALALPAGIGLGRAGVFLRPRGGIADAGLFAAVLGAGVTGAGAGALVAGGLLLSGDWHGLATVDIAIVAASIPAIAFSLQGQAALRGLGRAAWFRRLLAGRDLLFLVALLAALVLRVDATAALAAWTVHWFLTAAAVAWLLAAACGRPAWPRGAVRRLAVFGASQALVVLLMQAHFRLDVVALQALAGTDRVGQYAVAFGMAELVTYGGMAVGFALFPRTAASAAADKRRGAAATVQALRAAFAFALVVGLALAVAGPALVRLLFGAEFAAAGAPLRALLPGAVALAVLLVLQNDLSARGRPWPVAGCLGAVVAANLVLNLVLIPPLGVTGAAVASSVTYCAGAALLLGLFMRATGASLGSLVGHASEPLVPAGSEAGT
ncbi:MAG: glycosyltransferase [Gaiellaceae bacterium]